MNRLWITRKMMAVRMIPHMAIGHPLDAVFSRLGWKRAANYVHWRTLPKRGRLKATLDQVHFDLHPSLFWADFFFVPVCHLIGLFGAYVIAYRVFCFGPVGAVVKHTTHINFLEWGKLSKDPREATTAERRLEDFHRNRNRRRSARVDPPVVPIGR